MTINIHAIHLINFSCLELQFQHKLHIVIDKNIIRNLYKIVFMFYSYLQSQITLQQENITYLFLFKLLALVTGLPVICPLLVKLLPRFPLPELLPFVRRLVTAQPLVSFFFPRQLFNSLKTKKLVQIWPAPPRWRTIYLHYLYFQMHLNFPA